MVSVKMSERVEKKSLSSELKNSLQNRIIGQPGALDKIIPYVKMWKMGLTPSERPAGVFLLLGPTGSGKTFSVETLAESLHGSSKNVVKINCGEFQMEHEVAKLIGSPPGYLGHRETQPAFSQQKLSAVTSEASNLSLILFDEIEKAAPSMQRLLLGVLDKATLRLGDNTTVNFECSMIFMTSNLGAQEMSETVEKGFGLPLEKTDITLTKLQKITTNAVKRRFSPEFINRIDEIVTYNYLKTEDLRKILDLQLMSLQNLLETRISNRLIDLRFTKETKELLLQKGTSTTYGARELKRVLLRLILQPLVTFLEDNEDLSGIVKVQLVKGEVDFSFN